MDIIGSILAVLFIGLFITVALTFGFIVLIWFLCVAVLISACVLLKQWWLRWRFIRNAPPMEETTKVIDADFVEIRERKD